MQSFREPPATALLDLSRHFLPEALAGLTTVSPLASSESDLRLMNQIRAVSYLHVFDLFEMCLADAVRSQAAHDEAARDTLAPLLPLEAFDHNELFHRFERAFESEFPVTPKLAPRPTDFDEILRDAAPLSLLVLALHIKLVTQQHYLACVRGDESLEPAFVKVLKEHWAMECGHSRSPCSTLSIQQALGTALPGRVPSALRDYRRIVFVIDDLLRRQSELDVSTLEDARQAPLAPSDRETVLHAQVAAHRKTFITYGIVNAAFVYALRTLGPSAPAALAGVIAALESRV